MNFRDRLDSALRRERYLLWMMILLVVVAVMTYFCHPQKGTVEILFDVTFSLATTIITVLIVDLYNKKESDGVIKDLVKELILVKDDSLVTHYSHKDNKDIIDNCLGALYPKGQGIDKSLMGLINSMSTFRQDFCYDVDLDELRGGDDRIEVSQEIKYTRMFFTNGCVDFQVRCLFALDNGILDDKLNDTSFFYREELTDDEFVAQIKDVLLHSDDPTDMTRKICKMLDFSLSVKNQNLPGNAKEPIPMSDIHIDVDDMCRYFIIRYDLPKKYVRYLSGGELCQYRAYMKCRYPMQKSSHFYCVFSEPTIGRTNFSIDFNNVVGDVAKDVRYQTFLSSYTPIESELRNFKNDEIEVRSRSISFSSDKAIYPRSGMVFIWK